MTRARRWVGGAAVVVCLLAASRAGAQDSAATTAPVDTAHVIPAPVAPALVAPAQAAPAQAVTVQVSPSRAAATDVAPADSTPPARVVFDSPVRIPIELDHGLPMLRAWVNGHGPCRFGIETGGRLMAISPALAESLALPRLPSDSNTVHVDSISIGGVRFEDLHVTPLAVAQPGVDGLLGLSAFESVRLTIDYPDSTVIIERGELPGPSGGDIVKLQRVGSFWGVPISIGVEHWVAIIDTRSGGGLGFTPADTAYMDWEGPLRVVGQARGAQIPMTTVFGGTLAKDVQLGRHVFAKPFVTVRALPPGFPQNPILGSKALVNFTFTLDQINGRARFSRLGRDPIVLPEPRRMAPTGAPIPNAPPGAGAVPGSSPPRSDAPMPPVRVRPGDGDVPADTTRR